MTQKLQEQIDKFCKINNLNKSAKTVIESLVKNAYIQWGYDELIKFNK